MGPGSTPGFNNGRGPLVFQPSVVGYRASDSLVEQSSPPVVRLRLLGENLSPVQLRASDNGRRPASDLECEPSLGAGPGFEPGTFRL